MSAHLDEAELQATCEHNAMLREQLKEARCAQTIGNAATAPTGEALMLAWLKNDPMRRHCEYTLTMDGRIDITLWVDGTRFNSHTQLTLDSAYRTVLGIAMMEGEP